MSDPAAAAEHLKLIRGMMERATVYRAVSAPAAIFGGVLACATGGYFIVRASGGDGMVRGAEFFWTWVGVLLMVDVFNTVLLWRKAGAAGEPLFSPGLRLAAFSVAPALLAGGVLSYEVITGYDEFELCVLAWVLCYGVALLAMGGVAPRSLRRLGWLFVAAGVLLFLVWRNFGAAVKPQLGIGEVESASWIMIATFGLLHLVHGAGVLLRRGASEEVV